MSTNTIWTCPRCGRVFEGAGMNLSRRMGYGQNVHVCWDCYCVVSDDPPLGDDEPDHTPETCIIPDDGGAE